MLSVSDSEDEDEQWLVVITGLSSSFLPHFGNKGLCVGQAANPLLMSTLGLAGRKSGKDDERRCSPAFPSIPSITRAQASPSSSLHYYCIRAGHARPAATWLPACHHRLIVLVLFSRRCHACCRCSAAHVRPHRGIFIIPSPATSDLLLLMGPES